MQGNYIVGLDRPRRLLPPQPSDRGCPGVLPPVGLSYIFSQPPNLELPSPALLNRWWLVCFFPPPLNLVAHVCVCVFVCVCSL